MDRNVFDSKWKQIQSQSKGWWNLISDYDLEKIANAKFRFNKYVTMLQVKYGYTSEQATTEIGKRLAENEAEQKKNVD